MSLSSLPAGNNPFLCVPVIRSMTVLSLPSFVAVTTPFGLFIIKYSYSRKFSFCPSAVISSSSGFTLYSGFFMISSPARTLPWRIIFLASLLVQPRASHKNLSKRSVFITSISMTAHIYFSSVPLTVSPIREDTRRR